MAPRFHIAPAEDIPEGAQVCHYDELAAPAKERLPEVADQSGTVTADPAFESTVESCDLVKFTDYYRIERYSSSTDG